MARRNYIKELHELGLTYKQIAKETGYSKDMISSIAIGRRRLPKSDTKGYERIRNACRRATYAEARERGKESIIATKARRLRPEFVTKGIDKVWQPKKSTYPYNTYQLSLLGTFRNDKTQEIKEDIPCYSALHKVIDMPRMIDECEAFGQSQLGGSNWKMILHRNDKITQIAAGYEKT